jgi:hypothetical protein
MEIIDGEGGSGGHHHHHMWKSVVVEDCFNLLINLIADNYSNQKFFVETTNLLKKLCGYFNIITTTSSIDLNNQQTQTNLCLILRLFRCLVASFNSSYSSQKQQSIACQRAFAHFGLLHRLCATLMMMHVVPHEFLAQVIVTVSQIIRGKCLS